MALSRTVSGANLESGFAKHPDHTIAIEPAAGIVTVEVAGRKLVETAKALVLREANYPPVYYFPRDQVEMSALRGADHSTWCPFKGRASYFSIGEGDAALENAVWSYEDPFVECAAIKDFLAFYPTKATISISVPSMS